MPLEVRTVVTFSGDGGWKGDVMETFGVPSCSDSRSGYSQLHGCVPFELYTVI